MWICAEAFGRGVLTVHTRCHWLNYKPLTHIIPAKDSNNCRFPKTLNSKCVWTPHQLGSQQVIEFLRFVECVGFVECVELMNAKTCKFIMRWTKNKRVSTRLKHNIEIKLVLLTFWNNGFKHINISVGVCQTCSVTSTRLSKVIEIP